ncbi:hypothetical protein CAP35_13850 [Chitinophagaceae bacterium IBVUCB1]|nr:hypothetical protein CAP35_13850 [Chitinophagaceae bacterium IBVUCB1]
MQYHPQDIYIQNDYNANTLWVSHRLLCSALNISEGYLSKSRCEYKKSVSPAHRERQVLPDTGKSWRYAKINNKFYYAYPNIPDKHPAHYRSSLPPADELLSIYSAFLTGGNMPQDGFETRFKAALKEGYKEYLHCYNECTPAQQTNLAKYAAILEASVRWIREQHINTSKYDFFQSLAELVKHHAVPYAPENARVLKSKLQEVIDGVAITDIAKLPRIGNANREQYSEEEVKAWVLQLRDMGANYTNQYIIQKIKDMCMLTCKPAPSNRWIGYIMQQHNVKYLTAQQRFGSDSRFGSIYRGHQRFANALFAGDCWQVDGTRINIIAHKQTSNSDDGKKLVQQKFLYIVTVRDVHSGDILGYHYSVTEDRWAVHSAVKMAAKNAGYLPYEIIFDKFPGHNSEEGNTFLKDLEHWGVIVTMSSDANVKPAQERFYGTLQTVFMQESMLYYGQGIRSRRNYAHRSKEWVERMYKEANKLGFDFGDACAEATRILEAYRYTAYSKWSRKHAAVHYSPVELHDISEKPNVRTLEAQDYWYLFGLKKQLPIKHQGLIETEIAKVTYRYRCTDYNIISNYSHVLVCYDYEDLSQIMIYEPGDAVIKRYLGRVMEEKEAMRYGPDAQWSLIAEREAKIKELDGYREQELEYRKAVGAEDITALLHPMMISKKNYEQTESQYLLNQAQQNETYSDGEDIHVDIRNGY